MSRKKKHINQLLMEGSKMVQNLLHHFAIINTMPFDAKNNHLKIVLDTYQLLSYFN